MITHAIAECMINEMTSKVVRNAVGRLQNAIYLKSERETKVSEMHS